MRNQSEQSNFAAVKTPISQEALDQLFHEARTHFTWLPEPVSVELLRKAYELARLGLPVRMNWEQIENKLGTNYRRTLVN